MKKKYTMQQVYYEGIGIWITKEVTDITMLCKIHKLMEKNTVINMSYSYFRGQILLLDYDKPVKYKTFKRMLSKFCLNRGLLCHGIIIIMGKRHLVLLSFSSTFKIKEGEEFNIENLYPQWYCLERHEYTSFVNLLQFSSYEAIYMDAMKKHMNDNTDLVMDKLKELVSGIYKDISQVKKEIQVVRTEMQVIRTEIDGFKESEQDTYNVYNKRFKEQEEILIKISEDILSPLMRNNAVLLDIK